jgi:hypothetical protein
MEYSTMLISLMFVFELGQAVVTAAHAVLQWLPIVTTVLRTITSVVGVTIAVHRALRYWRRNRHCWLVANECRRLHSRRH